MRMIKTLKLKNEEQKQVGDIFKFAMDQGLCPKRGELGNNLFRATISGIPKIGYAIVEYQDEDHEGRKALIIANKLGGRKTKLLKIEKFEFGQWGVILLPFGKHLVL